MTYLEILDLIDRNYKIDDDWVYEKGKSREIKIIKALLEKYKEVRDELLDLMKQNSPLDNHPVFNAWNEVKTAPKKDKKREWVGLDKGEVIDIAYDFVIYDTGCNEPWFDRQGFARAIEDKLKEKNTC